MFVVSPFRGQRRNPGTEGESRATRERRNREKIELFTRGKNSKVRKTPLDPVYLVPCMTVCTAHVCMPFGVAVVKTVKGIQCIIALTIRGGESEKYKGAKAEGEREKVEDRAKDDRPGRGGRVRVSRCTTPSLSLSLSPFPFLSPQPPSRDVIYYLLKRTCNFLA